MPIKLEHPILTKEGVGKLQITIEPDRKRLTAGFKNNNFENKPDILSNSYSIN
jgi:hypothetical protein